MATKKHILVTALYWGLGHAVRCIPLIEHLLQQSCKVSIASDGPALEFLKEQFPQLNFFELPSYKVTYPTRSIYFNLALSTPSILSAIAKEYKSIQRLTAENHFDAIIADNRYGCYHKDLPSILITHQVNLIGNKLQVNKTASKIHQSLIEKFDDCWIPDISKAPGLSASMGHGPFSFSTKYLGFLSSFKKEPIQEEAKRALIIVLSGPEPQRTKLENKLLQQLNDFDREVLLVRGLVGATDPIKHSNDKIRIINYLNRAELQTEMNASKVLLCRSGYTSLMDLSCLKMPAILIPTPGQPEQEYLSKSLSDQGIFFHTQQDDLNLSEAYQKSLECNSLEFPEYKLDRYKEVLNEFVRSL